MLSMIRVSMDGQWSCQCEWNVTRDTMPVASFSPSLSLCGGLRRGHVFSLCSQLSASSCERKPLLKLFFFDLSEKQFPFPQNLFTLSRLGVFSAVATLLQS